jgi:hypothetical protein
VCLLKERFIKLKDVPTITTVTLCRELVARTFTGPMPGFVMKIPNRNWQQSAFFSGKCLFV